MIKNIACIGGDDRQKFTVSTLNENNFNVDIINMLDDNIEFYDAFILPLPATQDNKYIKGTDITVDDLIGIMPAEKTVFAGKLNDKIKKRFYENKIEVFDYYQREEFALKNAVPTALGVLNFVMNNSTKIIPDMKIMVIGYGKCGRAILKVFNSLGANVIAASRKYLTVAEAQSNGISACLIKNINENVNNCDVVINTVPSPIFGKNFIDLIKKSTLIIDIASAPYGFDYGYAKESHKKIVRLPSIPGVYFPQSAGNIIADTIMNIIEERRL